MNILGLLKLFGKDKIVAALDQVIRRRFTAATYDQLGSHLEQAKRACDLRNAGFLASEIGNVLDRIR